MFSFLLVSKVRNQSTQSYNVHIAPHRLHAHCTCADHCARIYACACLYVWQIVRCPSRPSCIGGMLCGTDDMLALFMQLQSRASLSPFLSILGTAYLRRHLVELMPRDRRHLYNEHGEGTYCMKLLFTLLTMRCGYKPPP